MLPSWCNDEITVYHPGIAMSRGTLIQDWQNVQTDRITGCSVQTNATSMDLAGRTQTELAGIIYAPPNSNIESGDRISFDGTIYVVDGEPMKWKSPTGRTSNLQVRIKRWEG